MSVVRLAFFVERIGGGRIEVEPLVPPGRNHHTYDPSPQQLARLARARIFFREGLPFENATLPKLASSFKNLELLDLSEGLELRALEAHAHGEGEAAGNETNHGDHERHENQQDGQGDAGQRHEEGQKDPHLWLSPRLMMRQADIQATFAPTTAAAAANRPSSSHPSALPIHDLFCPRAQVDFPALS